MGAQQPSLDPRAAPGPARPAALVDRCARQGAHDPTCRCCGAPLTEVFCDLGPMPLPAAQWVAHAAQGPEIRVPLRPLFCAECILVQSPGPGPGGTRPAATADPRLARGLAQRFHLDADSVVVELAGGDVSLLPTFAEIGLPVLCMAADAAAAMAAASRAIPTAPGGIGATAARRLRGLGLAAALISARGVLDTAPDPHDVVAGLRILLAPGGVLLIEVPHLMPVLRGLRFDAICHEQRCIFSLAAAEALLAEHGLAVFDVAAPAGTLRLLARHAEDNAKPVAPAVEAMRRAEAASDADACRAFAPRMAEAKCALLDFLVGLRRAGRSVAGIGATACADRLLRYCGVGPELLPFVADARVPAAGLCLPGTRIPVVPPFVVAEARPDFVLLLESPGRTARTLDPAAIGAWGGRLATPLPTLRIS